MLNKSFFLALSAVAVLGLAVSNANAKPGGFAPKAAGFGPGVVKPIGVKPIGIKPIVVKPHFPHKPHIHVHRHRPIMYVAPAVVGATYVATRPVVAGPCTCLSKEYTAEGVVVFKYRCTNEMAMNPPVVAPQQTGMLQPQYTPSYPPQSAPVQ